MRLMRIVLGLLALAGALVAALRALRRRVKGPRLAIGEHSPCASDNKGQRIGILVIAYNAVTTLSATLKRIPKEVWRQIEEVAVFDDASKDETFELAVGFKTLFGMDKLTVLRNQQNLGYGGNQKRGYQYFIDKGYDVVVMLHGDGHYAPEVLAHLYAPLVDGDADAVFGLRMMGEYGGPIAGGMPLYKFCGNKILTALANRLLGMRLTEFHSGYRAYRLAALKRIDFSGMTNDFHFDTEIIVKLKHQGFRITEVPIPTYYGKEICYVNGLKYAANVVRALWRYRRAAAGQGAYPKYAEYAGHSPPSMGGAPATIISAASPAAIRKSSIWAVGKATSPRSSPGTVTRSRASIAWRSPSARALWRRTFARTWTEVSRRPRPCWNCSAST